MNKPRPDVALSIRDFSRHPLHDGLEILHLSETGMNLVVPGAVANAISTCLPFRTAAKHAAAIAAKLGLKAEDVPRLVATLDEMVQQGMFASLDEIVANGRADRTGDGPPPISTIAFTTRDRLDSLERAVRSYGANATRHGHAFRALVADDSTESAVVEETHARLARLASELNTSIRHVGQREKRAFADALAHESGVDARVVEFALFDVFGCGRTYGGNRNLVLLLTGGEHLLMADDDSICRPAVAPEPIGGVRFVGELDPREYWFFEDAEAAVQSGRYEDIDVLSQHERLLGRTLAAVVAEDPPGAELSGVCRHMVHGLCNGARIRVTPSGILGDSGMNTPTWLLAARPPTRDRLLSSEEAYRRALTSRGVMKASRGFAVAHRHTLHGGVYGIDNRTSLVPFFPVLRNEDGVFTAALNRCFENAYLGYPPHALLHAPDEKRSFPASQHVRGAEEWRMSYLVNGLIGTCPPASSKRMSPTFMGRHLIEIASQPSKDFAGMARQLTAMMATKFCGAFSASLRENAAQPSYWAEDMRTLLKVHTQAAASPGSWLPSDLRTGRTDDDVAALAQRLVLAFGELLVGWEALNLAAGRAKERAGLA
jgi:hypothetical protein